MGCVYYWEIGLMPSMLVLEQGIELEACIGDMIYVLVLFTGLKKCTDFCRVTEYKENSAEIFQKSDT